MKTIMLPPVIDRTVTAELTPELTEALGTGTGILIAAGNVRQIGQCGLQLLLSAALTASRRDMAFIMQDASEAFMNAVRISGLRRHLFGHAVQTL
jgi:anti-anti-sigma regulatory factor